MITDKNRPAPYLVCTYSFGEGELPTVRTADDPFRAQEIAQQEAAAKCMPVVRVYSIDEDGTCKLVMSVRA